MSRHATRLLPLTLALGLHGAPASAANVVEVVLASPLDEPRGYCLDVVGSQWRARPDRGLQAHTCYSYQGRIAVDQAFDATVIGLGEFRLPGFQVCMTLPVAREGLSLGLRPCDGRPEQRFDLTAAGQLVPRAASRLCVTVGGNAGASGGGGNPLHLLRPLTVEACAPARAAHQTWRVRSKVD